MGVKRNNGLGATNRRTFLFGGIKMEISDCSLYSSDGKYIMNPSKEWDAIAQYLTDAEIQKICKGYTNPFGCDESSHLFFLG